MNTYPECFRLKQEVRELLTEIVEHKNARSSRRARYTRVEIVERAIRALARAEKVTR